MGGFSENTDPRLPDTMMIHAPMDFGKTVLAMTASEFFPGPEAWKEHCIKLSIPAERKLLKTIHLPDMFHAYWDGDAIVGLPSLKLSVPSYDLSHDKGQGILDNMNKCLALIQQRVKEGKTKKAVFDTVSTYNLKLIAWARSMYERNAERDDDKAKDNNSRILYRFVLGAHIEFLDAIMALDCMKILLCHSTTRGSEADTHKSASDAARDAKFEVQGLKVGETNIVAAITGQAWDHYHRNVSLVCNMSKSVKSNFVAGKMVEEVTRTLHPRAYEGAFNRTRFHMLDRDEPAHLGVLFKKILEG